MRDIASLFNGLVLDLYAIRIFNVMPVLDEAQANDMPNVNPTARSASQIRRNVFFDDL